MLNYSLVVLNYSSVKQWNSETPTNIHTHTHTQASYLKMEHYNVFVKIKILSVEDQRMNSFNQERCPWWGKEKYAIGWKFYLSAFTNIYSMPTNTVCKP